MKSFSYHILSAIGAGAMIAILGHVARQMTEAPKGVAPVVEAGLKLGWEPRHAAKPQHLTTNLEFNRPVVAESQNL